MDIGRTKSTDDQYFRMKVSEVYNVRYNIYQVFKINNINLKMN